MKKVITVLITAIALTVLLSVSAFAEELSAEAVTKGNIFDTVYGMLLENADKIFAALAFCASVVIMLVYKRGLLPILKNALTALAASVKGLKEETEKRADAADEYVIAAAKQLENAENALSGLSLRLTELEEKLKSADELKGDSERLRIIMECQVDMLYSVFMSSSLPAYEKEEIGEKILKMKRTLEAKEVTEDEKNGD